ncbi:MAG: GspH/FimT family pseudopilin [Acidobacteria bacterium]|nr:GspH/FimT family pseudopilin [Acidobacteriota bacterium]MCI0722732.1 GspH/FimT family pseudopilin [Acidobacteriota bacterium]
MCCKILKENAGLSLLEVVAGTAVILTMSALAFPQIGRYWQLYELDSATQMLSSNLEVARYTAISRKYNAVAQFYVAASWYEIFEDKNGNGARDSGELSLGSYSLPRQVLFSGNSLLGPPANPSGAVADPITFGSDRVVFNPTGKVNSGLGTIYLQNSAGDASALSFNMASRLKIYRWNKSVQTWN